MFHRIPVDRRRILNRIQNLPPHHFLGRVIRQLQAIETCVGDWEKHVWQPVT